MIIIIKDNECFEPRLNIYTSFFEKEDKEYLVLGWNRSGKANHDKRHVFYEKRALYGTKIRNIPKKVAWMFFVFNQLWKNRNKCSVVHACDVDAAIPSYIFSKIFKKVFVFDVFDWISNDLENNFVFSLIETVENLIYKKADYVILCEDERRQQAKEENDRVCVLPNIPNQEYKEDIETKKVLTKEREKFKYSLGYVGVFDNDRGLLELIEAVKQNEDVILEIAGFGFLESKIEELVEGAPNIHYWGRVSYDVGATISHNVDIIVGFYYLTNPVHKFAAPNKYYESIKYGRPLLTNRGTILADKVEKYSTGFVVDEGKQAADEFLRNIDYLSIKDVSGKSSYLWENKYKNYVDEFMYNTYLGDILKNG